MHTLFLKSDQPGLEYIQHQQRAKRIASLSPHAAWRCYICPDARVTRLLLKCLGRLKVDLTCPAVVRRGSHADITCHLRAISAASVRLEMGGWEKIHSLCPFLHRDSSVRLTNEIASQHRGNSVANNCWQLYNNDGYKNDLLSLKMVADLILCLDDLVVSSVFQIFFLQLLFEFAVNCC